MNNKVNRKVILSTIGILLVIVQIVNFCGVSRMSAGILPSNEDLLYPNYMLGSSKLIIEDIFIALQAGIDRFASGFEDLIYPLDTGRNNSSIQILSAFTRESLGCSDDGSFGLMIYDILVLLSYWSVGIIGLALLIVATKIKEPSKNENNEINESTNKTCN